LFVSLFKEFQTLIVIAHGVRILSASSVFTNFGAEN